MTDYTVMVERDDEAGVYVTTETNIPGFCAQGATVDEIWAKSAEAIGPLLSHRARWRREQDMAAEEIQREHRAQLSVTVTRDVVLPV